MRLPRGMTGVVFSLVCAQACSGTSVDHPDAGPRAESDGGSEPVTADGASQVIPGDAAVTQPEAGGGDARGGAGGGGLIAHWSFDEGSGNLVTDDAGGLIGTIVNGLAEDAADAALPAWVPGHDGSGSALDLGSLLTWVRVADAAALDRVASSNAITMAAWIRPSRLSIQGWDFIASRQVRGTSSEHFGFGFFMAKPSCTIYGTTVSGPTDRAFRWVHIAFTYDGRICRVFADGTEVARLEIGSPLQPDDTPLALGANIDPPSPDDRINENLRAIIDDVWLFDRALGAEEIAALAQ